MSEIPPISICFRCRFRGTPAGGKCACKIDRVDISIHAASLYCPHFEGPRFGDGIKPNNWDCIERVGEAGEQVEELIARDSAEGDCGCAGGTTDVKIPK